MRFLLGVDLGEMNDPTAFVLTEHVRAVEDPNIADTPRWDRRPKKIRNEYATRKIERPPLGTSYPDIVRRTKAILQHPDIVGETQLIVDATGVGIPVIEMMKEEGLNPIGIWITGGDQWSKVDYGYRVPKRDIATAAQIVFQSRRIKIARSLELAPVMIQEMGNFRIKIENQHDKYEAWRSGQHDDIVLSQAIILWYAEKVYPQSTMLDDKEHTTAEDWNPLLL